MAVFVLDKRKKPPMSCSETQARLLLACGGAVVHPRHPVTVSLKDGVGGDVQTVRVKIDPGSKTTGVAIITDAAGNKAEKLPCLFELARREPQISEAVTARRRFRRRRGANLRYTAPRFDNRTIKAQARAPLQDAVNATRWALYEALADTGWTVEASSCGRTKYNRARLSIVKTHVFDAAWVGEVGTLVGWQIPSTEKKASAGGDYCRTKLNPHGLPRGYCMGSKSVRGFKTGDLVRAEVPKSKQPAIQVERVASGVSGSLTVARPAQSTPTTANFSIARTGYAWWPALPAPAEAGGLHRGRFG